MGFRESRSAMSRGGLIGLLNIERAQHTDQVLREFDVEAVAALLHDMSGPFNFRMQSSDVDSRIVHSAERVSTLVAMAIVEDVRSANAVAGSDSSEVVNTLTEAFCSWVDGGAAVPGIDAKVSQSAQIARLMAETSRVDVASAEAANVRMLTVSRFAAALGATDVVLRVPKDVHRSQASPA